MRLACIALGLLLAAASTGLSAPPSLSIDLLKATINGRLYTAYTMDEITDLLGRPDSSVEPKHFKFETSEYHVGTVLKYHDQGIQLTCQHPLLDAQQHVLYVTLFVVPADDSHDSKMINRPHWDDTPPAQYQAFAGTITPPVDANSKVKSVVAQHAQAAPEVAYRSVVVNLGTHTIVYNYDPNTKFIEEVVIDPPHDED